MQKSEVSIFNDEWKLYQAESEKNVTAQDEQIDHYWQSLFKLKTLSGPRKYPLPTKLVKSVFSLYHGNTAVEPSLSDNKNTVTTDRTELLNETIVSLSRMKVYARSKGGTHNVFVTPRMAQLLGEVKKKNEEKLENEEEGAF